MYSSIFFELLCRIISTKEAAMHWAYRWLIAASALLAVGVAIQVVA